MRIVNFYGRCDTLYQDGFTESEIQDYKSAIHLAYIRNKPIEKINDREVFSYFSIGDSIQDFLSRLGSKKVHKLYDGGYAVSFPHELTKEPEVFEFNFYEGTLISIKRISPTEYSLPTNDIRTALWLLKLQDELKGSKKATKLKQQSKRK